MYFYLINSNKKNETSPSSILHSESMVQSYDNKYDNPNSVWNWWRNKLPPDSDGIQLVKNAVITDLINAGPLTHGIVVSPRFLNLLFTFNVLRPKYTSAKMYNFQGKEIPYYFYFLEDVFLDYLVDFEKSSFRVHEGLGGDEDVRREKADRGIKCKDQNSVYKKGGELKANLAYDIVYLNGSDKMDILHFKYSWLPRMIVSERVRSAIIENEITGVTFEPIHFELHFIGN